MVEEKIPSVTRLMQAERDLIAHAKSITEIVQDQRLMHDELEVLNTDKAVRVEKDKAIDERFARMEASIKSVYGLGKWVLAAVASTLVSVIVNFIIGGGLKGG